MGTSSYAKICFGIVFEEGFEFPWDKHPDIEEWWFNEIHKYKPPFEIYDEKGNWLNGVKPSEDAIKEYYDHLHKFKSERPLPVELLNYCAYEQPMYILTLKETIKMVEFGEVLDINDLRLITNKNHEDILEDFCFDYGIVCDKPPTWYLTAFMG